MTKALLEAGADANTHDDVGRTPLDSHKGRAESADGSNMLLKYGVDINATSDEDMTPMKNAIYHGATPQDIELFIEAGALVDRVDSQGKHLLSPRLDITTHPHASRWWPQDLALTVR